MAVKGNSDFFGFCSQASFTSLSFEETGLQSALFFRGQFANQPRLRRIGFQKECMDNNSPLGDILAGLEQARAISKQGLLASMGYQQARVISKQELQILLKRNSLQKKNYIIDFFKAGRSVRINRAARKIAITVEKIYYLLTISLKKRNIV